MLIGKAKEDFLLSKFFPTQGEVYFNDLDNSCKNALIIEWFDNVGIYIQNWGLEVTKDNIGFDCSINIITKLIPVSDSFFKTRQEATTEAIKKAVEIYNNQKTTP